MKPCGIDWNRKVKYRRKKALCVGISAFLCCELFFGGGPVYETDHSFSSVLFTVTADAANAPTVSGTEDYDMAYNMFQQLNKVRTDRGLPALGLDSQLQSWAMLRAEEQAYKFSIYTREEYKKVAHIRPNGLKATQSMSGVRAENLADRLNYPDPVTDAMNSFLSSTSGHSENMLNAAYGKVGIGVFRAPDGRYFFVQLFGEGGASGSPKTSGQAPKSVVIELPAPPATNTPTPAPTNTPTPKPTVPPTPTPKPTVPPTPKPTVRPANTPTPKPTARPANTPTPKPTARPANTPTPKPTVRPVNTPTPKPTVRPANTPTPRPTSRPTSTNTPTPEPTSRPLNTGTPTPGPVAPGPSDSLTVREIDVEILGTHYAGDTLSENDIVVSVTMSDGSVWTNPEGIKVSDLHLSGTSNTIRVTYRGVTESVKLIVGENPDSKETDENGDPIETDENGDPIETDENGDTIETDENGDPIETDENGDPIETDENGDPIETDEDGNPVETDENGKRIDGAGENEASGKNRSGDTSDEETSGYSGPDGNGTGNGDGNDDGTGKRGGNDDGNDVGGKAGDNGSGNNPGNGNGTGSGNASWMEGVPTTVSVMFFLLLGFFFMVIGAFICFLLMKRRKDKEEKNAIPAETAGAASAPVFTANGYVGESIGMPAEAETIPLGAEEEDALAAEREAAEAAAYFAKTGQRKFKRERIISDIEAGEVPDEEITMDDISKGGILPDKE